MTNPINERVALLQHELINRIDQSFMDWLGATDVEDALRITANLATLGVRPVIEYDSPHPVNLTPGDGNTYALESSVWFRYVPIEPTA